MPARDWIFECFCHLPKSADSEVMQLVTLQLAGHHVDFFGTSRETFLSFVTHNVSCLSSQINWLIEFGWKAGYLFNALLCRWHNLSIIVDIIRETYIPLAFHNALCLSSQLSWLTDYAWKAGYALDALISPQWSTSSGKHISLAFHNTLCLSSQSNWLTDYGLKAEYPFDAPPS